MVDLIDGWLTGVRRCYSPNFDARPAGETPDLLVVHNISLPPDVFEGDCIEAFFCNCLPADRHPYFQEIADLRVSAHFLIERSGRLTQFVSCDARAWHAGQSSYQGRERCNDFSIGVELQGADSIPYTQAQYNRLSWLSHCMIEHYPGLSVERITGHSDIAPGRKTDPGEAFDWRYFHSLLSAQRGALWNS